jgi:glycosyltransferase involved in cell wall biosynthesis
VQNVIRADAGWGEQFRLTVVGGSARNPPKWGRPIGVTTKVVYLIPRFVEEPGRPGGEDRFIMGLAGGVVEAARGAFEVEVLVHGDRDERRAIGPGVSVRVLETVRTPDPLDAIAWGLVEAIEDADLVHVHEIYTRATWAALLAAKAMGKPVCLTDHGARGRALGVEADALDLADRVIAHSAFGASLSRTTVPVAIIAGGVDPSRFSPPPDRSPRDRVLCVGPLHPSRGIDLVLAALPEDVPLTVSGRPGDDDYGRRVRALASGRRVEFVDAADEETLRDLYRRALATIVATVHRDASGRVHRAPDVVGLTVLESLACGTPALASRAAAPPEFIEDGATGFVFDDRDDLARRIRLLADDPALVDRMGRAGRRAVEARYGIATVGEALAGVYREVLSAEKNDTRHSALGTQHLPGVPA